MVLLTKDEKDYILSLIDSNTEDISKLEGAISDDHWIYDIYDVANSIRDKFAEDNYEHLLRIIIEKNVNIAVLKNSPDLKYYNYHVSDWRKLTQEEFDLLKKEVNRKND